MSMRILNDLVSIKLVRVEFDIPWYRPTLVNLAVPHRKATSSVIKIEKILSMQRANAYGYRRESVIRDSKREQTNVLAPSVG